MLQSVPFRRVALVAIVVISVLYVGINVRELQRTRHALETRGKQILLDQEATDPFHRDILIAFEVRYGSFWRDPNTLSAGHWYPFAAPTVAATVQRIVGWDMHASYLLAGILLVALGWLATGAWLLRWAGVWSVVAFLLVRDWDSGVSPAVTAPVARAALLWSLCRLLTVDALHRQRWAFLTGGAVGLLGLWHGASFYWSGALSVLVLGAMGESPIWRRYLQLLPAFALGVAIPISLLLAPQWILNGELVDYAGARLYLWDVFHDGNDWPGFFSTRLLPSGMALLCLMLAFVLVLWRGRYFLPWQRRLFWCLAASWLLCVVETKLGFIVHVDSPMVSRLAIRFLFVPAHTWYELGLWVARLLFAVGAGFTVATLPRISKERRAIAAALMLATLVSVVVTWRERIRFQDLPTVPVSVVRFAERVSGVSRETAVLFGGPLAHYAFVKGVSPGLWRNYCNPKLFDESRQLSEVLTSAGLQGNDELYRQARTVTHADYMLEDTSNPPNAAFARRCGEEPAIAATGNLRLLRLRDVCQHP